jgi:DNA-binding XRE family transcriptional regulator
MIKDNRMELYREGLTDKEIAAKLDISKKTIVSWRHRNKLPNCANRMETALTPDQCKVMRDFFRLLLTASDRNPGNVDVSRIINFYREEYGGEGRKLNDGT